MNPLADDAVIKKVPLQCFPRDLFMVARTVMLLRGLVHALDLDVQARPLIKKGSWRGMPACDVSCMNPVSARKGLPCVQHVLHKPPFAQEGLPSTQ